MSLTLAFHVLVSLHHVDHDCSKVVMRNLILILRGASTEVYDWLHIVTCHLHVDFMSPTYILIC